MQASARQPYSYRDAPSVPAFDDAAPLVVFDGACGLCTRSMRLLVRLDRARRFSLTRAQGPLGRSLYHHLGLSTESYDTYLLVADGRIYQRSDAIVEIARRLPYPGRLGAAVRLLPKPIRDGMYDIVAKHRYRIFGRAKLCPIDDAGLRERLL